MLSLDPLWYMYFVLDLWNKTNIRGLDKTLEKNSVRVGVPQECKSLDQYLDFLMSSQFSVYYKSGPYRSLHYTLFL